METIAGLLVGVAIFICTIKAYTLGVSHGKQLSEGRVPKIQLNPVKAVTQAIEQHEQAKEEKKADTDLNDIFSYSVDTALTAIKKQNARL